MKSKRAIVSALCVCCLVSLAADVQRVIEVSETRGLRIQHCHPDDRALIEIFPVDQAHSWGTIGTTNTLLVLKDFSMAPSGTNLLRVRTVCSGVTGEVSTAMVWIKRRPPAPGLEREHIVVVTEMPPMPGGLIVALPAGTNSEYADRRQKR